MIDYSLYLVTDDPSRYSGNWLDNVVAAVEGGVTCVQYRDTESAPAVRLARVRALQDALARFGTPLVINNEAELAAAVRAEGVHVGQSDLPPSAVRAIVGPRCEIGLSITDISQLFPVDAHSAHVPALVDAHSARVPALVNALGIGPVFDARKTKADAAAALGLSGLSSIVSALRPTSTSAIRPASTSAIYPTSTSAIRPASTSAIYPTSTSAICPTSTSTSAICNLKSEIHQHNLPCIAIGGITLANAASVLAAGADGLAIVSAFSRAADPFAVAQSFRKIISEKGRPCDRRDT